MCKRRHLWTVSCTTMCCLFRKFSEDSVMHRAGHPHLSSRVYLCDVPFWFVGRIDFISRRGDASTRESEGTPPNWCYLSYKVLTPCMPIPSAQMGRSVRDDPS